MELTTVVAFASLGGAVLFFASGYVANSVRRGMESQPSEPRADGDAAQLREAQARAEALAEQQQQANKALQQAEKQVSQLAAVRSELEAAQQQLQQKEQLLAGVRGELKQAGRELELAQQRCSESDTARQQQTAALEKARGAEGAARRKLAELTSRCEELQDELDGLGEATATNSNLAAQRAVEELTLQLERAKRDAEAGQKAAEAAQRAAKDAASSAKQREEATKRARALEAQLAAAERRAGDVAGERDRLQQEIDGLREQLLVLEQRAKAPREAPMASERLEELSGENAELRQQLEQLERSTVPQQELEKLRSQQRHMLVQARMLQQRADEMEQHANENVGLKQQLTLKDEQLAQAEKQRELLRRAEALLLSAGLSLDPPQERSAAAPGAGERPDTRASALEAKLQALLEHQGGRAVVLADEQGLQLAGSGAEAQHEPLAVLSAAVADLNRLAADLLPFEEGRAFELIDRNGVVVASRLFRQSGQSLLLTSVGPVQPTANPAIDEVVAEVQAIVAE